MKQDIAEHLSGPPVWNREDIFGVFWLQQLYPLLHLSLPAGNILYVEQSHIQLLLHADYTVHVTALNWKGLQYIYCVVDSEWSSQLEMSGF